MATTNTRIGRKYPVATTDSKLSDTAIMAQIVSQFVDRSRQGITNWRNGQEMADDIYNPRWYVLQDLFEYLSTDGHFQSQWGIRKGALLGKRFYIRDSGTGQENKDKTKLLQKRWFFIMVSRLLDAELKANTVIQASEPEKLLNSHPLELPFQEIPRRNFIPQKNFILFDATGGTTGVSITDPAFNNTIICVKSEHRFGLMNYIVPDLIWKKNARQAWAEFGDKFGIPLVKIETNKTNKADLDKLEAMAKLMGEAARAILPSGSKMDIIDSATKGDPHKVYLEQINLGNDEISKLLLGGTMISGDGSSRSQSEVHERQLDNKVTAMDLTNIEFTINDQLMPLLIAGGFPFDIGDEFVYDRTQTLTLKEHWEIVKGIIDGGYEVDDQYIRETFNIPIIGKKEPKPAEPAVPVNQPESFFD